MKKEEHTNRKKRDSYKGNKRRLWIKNTNIKKRGGRELRC